MMRSRMRTLALFVVVVVVVSVAVAQEDVAAEEVARVSATQDLPAHINPLNPLLKEKLDKHLLGPEERRAAAVEDFPAVPERLPHKLTPKERADIDAGKLYMWSPDNRDKGNMNEVGFDSLDMPAIESLVRDETHTDEVMVDDDDDLDAKDDGLLEGADAEDGDDDDESTSTDAPFVKEDKEEKQQAAFIETNEVPTTQKEADQLTFDGDEQQQQQKDKKPSPANNVDDEEHMDVAGPVKLAEAETFPAFNGAKLSCHTDEELRKYLDLMGVDHDKETGVPLVQTPYYLKHGKASMDAREARDARWEIMWDGQEDEKDGFEFKHTVDSFHYFYLHSAPDNKDRTRRCYDAELRYETDLEQISPVSQEVDWGCTPFRVVGQRAQAAVKCAIGVMGEKEWERVEDDFMRTLSYEAMRQPSAERFDQAVRVRVEQLFNNTADDVKKAIMDKQIQKFAQGKFRTVAVWDEDKKRLVQKEANQTNNAIEVLNDCFRSQQKALACTPVLGGSAGMRGHGLADHNPKWVQREYKVVKTCHIPPGCARLATSQLMNFNMREYRSVLPGLEQRSTPVWRDQCRTGEETGNSQWFSFTSQGNSRLFAACQDKSIRRVCSVYPECCPRATTHDDCANDVTGKRCAEVCRAHR